MIHLASLLLTFIFDVLVVAGKDLRRKTLERRPQILEDKILPKLAEPVR
jgi:ATP-dependent DNA ligase